MRVKARTSKADVRAPAKSPHTPLWCTTKSATRMSLNCAACNKLARANWPMFAPLLSRNRSGATEDTRSNEGGKRRAGSSTRK